MFDTRIEILEYRQMRDEYNDRTQELMRVAVCYAQRTESGGRENLYAGRIVHENEVVYTIRYREGLRAGMIVNDGGAQHRITSIHAEGRKLRSRVMPKPNVFWTNCPIRCRKACCWRLCEPLHDRCFRRPKTEFQCVAAGCASNYASYVSRTEQPPSQK